MVKTIEKSDPLKAKALVDDLQNSRGKSNAREKAAAVKDVVKPSKKLQNKKGVSDGFAGAKLDRDNQSLAHERVLARAYDEICRGGKQPSEVFDSFSDAERDSVEAFLQAFYEAGGQATDAGRVVIEGFRNGGFASKGVGAFALMAYLQGVCGKAFNLTDILRSVTP